MQEKNVGVLFVCLLLNNANTAFHHHLTFGKITAQFIISMHIHPMNPQS